MQINLVNTVGFVKQVCHFTILTVQIATLPHLSTNILHTLSDNDRHKRACRINKISPFRKHPIPLKKKTLKGGLVIRTTSDNHDYS
jgi:hypothetical protein